MKYLVRYKVYENTNSDFYKESSRSEWLNDYIDYFIGFDRKEISRIQELLNKDNIQINILEYNKGFFLSLTNTIKIEEFQIYKGKDEYYFIKKNEYYFICDQYDGLLKFFKENNI